MIIIDNVLDTDLLTTLHARNPGDLPSPEYDRISGKGE